MFVGLKFLWAPLRVTCLLIIQIHWSHYLRYIIKNFYIRYLEENNIKESGITKISSVEGRFKVSLSEIESKKLLHRGIYDKDYGVCYPVANIIYERIYYKIKNIRLTIDNNISYRQASKNGASVFTTKDNFSVVEIKYNSDMNNNLTLILGIIIGIIIVWVSSMLVSKKQSNIP